MFRRTVEDRDGRRWRVGRRWIPSKPVRLARARGLGDGGPDFGDLGGDDIFSAILAVIGAIILAVFLALLLFNVIAIAIELTVLIVVVIGGVIGRVLFRKPWSVEARWNDRHHAWPVVGWRESGRAIRTLRAQLASGAELDPAAGDRARLDD